MSDGRNRQRSTTVGSGRSRQPSISSSVDTFNLERQREARNKRRFFIILLFDALLVAIVWLLNTVSRGRDWFSDFKREIDITDKDFFSKSLFDVAYQNIHFYVLPWVNKPTYVAVIYNIELFSAMRVLWLSIWYGGSRQRCPALPWLPAAVAALLTSAFLIVKVMYYFSGNAGTAPEYTLIVGSLILTWLQLWFVPVQFIAGEGVSSCCDDRQRRTETVLHPGDDASDRVFIHHEWPQPIDDYRSAMETAGSSNEDDAPAADARRRQRLTLAHYRPYSNVDYVAAATKAREECAAFYQSVADWTVVSKDKPVIRSTQHDVYGKIYYVKMVASCSAAQAFQVLHTETESAPQWNKNVVQSRVVFRVDPHTDLTHSVSAPALRGAVASRVRVWHLEDLTHCNFCAQSQTPSSQPSDFLDVRHFTRQPDGQQYTICVASVLSTILPPVGKRHGSKLVRGFNGPTLWLIKQGENGGCTIEWIMNTNLKGELPRRLVDRSILPEIGKRKKNSSGKRKRT